MVIGLDIGYGYTKVYTDRNGQVVKSIFPSSVSRYIPEKGNIFASAISPILVNNILYIVGDDVSDTLLGLSGYRVNSGFVGNNEYFAIIGYVLSQFKGPVDVLVLGLPPELYETERVATLKKLLYTTEFKFADGNTIPYPSKVEYIPQGAGIYFSYINNGNYSERNKNIVVIDIGYYTLDMVMFSKGKYIAESGKSYPKGIKFVLEKIKTKYAKKYASFIGDHAAETILSQGVFRHFGKEYELDVSDIIDDFYKNQLKNIVNEYAIATKDAKQNVEKIIIGGGGISSIGKIEDAVIVHDPQFANARGYYEYGKALREIS